MNYNYKPIPADVFNSGKGVDKDGSCNPKADASARRRTNIDETLFLGSPSFRTGLVLHVHIWKYLHTDLTEDFLEDTRLWPASMLTQLVTLRSLDIRL